MSYSHVVFCGDSYMRCYIDAGGPLDLCNQLGAEPIMLYRSGSAHEYVINHIYNTVAKLPKALVIWGLSHPHRIDVPYNNPKSNVSMWATLNNDHLVGNDGIHDFSDIDKNERLLNIFIDYLVNIKSNNRLFIEQSLQQIKFTAAWLTSVNHDYLIWNQTLTDFSLFKKFKFTVASDIENDSGFYNIFDWCMNQHLHDCNIPFRKSDMHDNKWNISAHPLECVELNNEINKFILDNLKGRNLI